MTTSAAPRPATARSERASGRLARGTGPLPLAAAAWLGMAFLVVPLVGLLARAPWTRLPSLISRPPAPEALQLSLVTSICATVVTVVLGVPLAWLLSRMDGRLGNLLRAIVTLPLVLPPVVGGVALLLTLGRRGMIGSFLDEWFGITFPFTTAAVIIAEAFVAMPFLVIAAEGALRSLDRGYADAARTPGASSWRVFTRVTLPLVAPGLTAGIVLAWARALGEFGATITFAGNFPGTTQTVPLAVYLAMETDPDAGIALSVILLAVCVAVLVTLRRRWLIGGAG